MLPACDASRRDRPIKCSCLSIPPMLGSFGIAVKREHLMSDIAQSKSSAEPESASAGRPFLSRAGKVALAAPPATSLILAAASKPALANPAYGGGSSGQGKGQGK